MPAAPHPDLRLSKLSRLPLRPRRIASDAANGSSEALAQILDIIVSGRGDRMHLLFLPVVYAVLDPARLPAPDELDTQVLGDAATAVAQSFTAIRVLNAIQGTMDLLRGVKLDTELYFDLWPRLDYSMKFILSYRYCLQHPTSQGDALFHLFARVTGFLFNADMPTAGLIAGTEGVRVILARSWAGAVLSQDLAGVLPLTRLFGAALITAAYLDEFNDGVEGLGDFSSLLVQHFELVMSHPTSAKTDFLLARPVLFFIRNLYDYDSQVFQTVVGCGLPRALTRCINTLLPLNLPFEPKSNDTVTLASNDTVTLAFDALVTVASAPGSRRWMAEALEAGLLVALVSLTTHDSVPTSAGKLLGYFLPASIAHSSVVRQIDISLGAINDETNVDKILSPSRLFDEWKLFNNLMLHHGELHTTYRSGNASQACDNMKGSENRDCRLCSADRQYQCGAILPRSTCGRCSGCVRRYYCTQECQKIDWKEGHRVVCKKLRPGPELKCFPGRGFMRALLHDAYESTKPDLLLQQLVFSISNPDAEYYTVYDHSVIPPDFKTLPLATKLSEPNPDPIWVDAAARARRSGGTMELHALAFLDGTTSHMRIMPLRSNHPDIYTGLRQIARDIPIGADVASMCGELKEKIEALLRDASEVVQIHCD